MSKEIYISSTPHETRLAIVEDEALTEIYYERENEYTLAGSIYNGRVTRVLPGMQSSFVDIGLERDAFLYITDFMEETPDSDEFDTAPAGDRAPRQPRLGNGEQPASNGERSDRGDRGGRGRRGGRDRDRNGDRNNNSERQASSDAPRPQEGERDFFADRPVAEGSEGAAPRDLNDAGEIGEGAPGAEAGRRWRGRRGRRRGRGGERQAGDPTRQQGDQTQMNAAPVDGEAPAYPEALSYDDDSSSERDSYVEIDGETARSTTPSSTDAPREDRPREYRNGRRDRGRDDRNRDGQRSDQRGPRGFEPSRNLYGVDSEQGSGTGPISNAYPDEIEAGAEPIILPGESLSKYRKGGDEPTAATAPALATPVPLAPPANLYTLASGWDGGAVLPGETLSRRSSSESRPELRNDSRHESRGGSRNDSRGGRRDSRPDRYNRSENRPDNRPDNRNETLIATAAVVQQGFEPAAPIAEVVEEFNQQSVAEVHVDETPAVAAEPVAAIAPAAETEYEPTEAAASYRVDPVAPSEFRQSGSILEAVSEPHPDVVAELLAPEPEAPAAEAHDVTTIAPTGEMLSEPVVAEPLVAIEQPASVGLPQQVVPEFHEEPVTESTPQNTEATSQIAEAAPQIAASFAPGPGRLDEEILDEDDAEPAAIHASSIEEIDDLDEEEAVEGATEIGTMLREMSIDQITRTTPEGEEEDDLDEDEGFEEDDLDEEELDEEDQDEEDELDADSDEEDAARTGTAADSESFEAQFNQTDEATRPAEQAPRQDRPRDERRGGRRDGRRDVRRGRNDRGDRPRNTGGSGERGGHQHGGHGRHSVQATDLPAISDLLKPGQEILVQIAKEPIAKKGARITSHIALPGRFLVFMPTVNHTGVSRKIESDGERRRLKEILLSEKGDATGGFIVRTAAEGASEEELRSDLRFLLNLWADIKSRSESSKSPALIYHDLNLVERILRDQVTDNFSAIWVDTEDAYERVLRFLQRFQPSLIRRVKLYTKDTPLFEQFGITEEINKALRSKVWLKSGGSIVINQTEALVAIDINTGKYVGKTARLEDTIVKTNLDAIPEIVRQIRLRDLGGIIIIDFIDMDERKNRNRVMAALEEELKTDRAPSKVLQFNDFGLVAITRKRVKQSLERTLSTTCTICDGTGMVKSPITVCNDIYIEMRKMHKVLDRGDIMLRVHPEVVKQLKTSGAKWLLEMEEMVGKTILVKSDPALHPEQFDIH
jgi:ribonuclease G